MTALKSATPAWLLEGEMGLCPCGCIGKRRKGSYVTKTINGAARVMRQAMFADDVSAQDGVLQRLDPRAKLLTLLGLLVAVSFVRRLPVLLAAYAGTLVLAALSRLSLSFFIKRVWLFIPIFTGVVVLPATLDIVTSGHVVVPLGTWFGYHLGMTSQGLSSAGLIVVRVATSISLVVLLTLTTPWTRLLAALRALFIPRMFILVLGMAYRYLFHLLGTVTDMYVARQARTVGPDAATTSSRAFVSASAGALFGKTQQLSEEVHMAMVSRGYDGNTRTLSTFALQPLDLAWIATATLLAVLVIGFGRGF